MALYINYISNYIFHCAIMDQEVFPLPEPPFTKDTPVARIVNIDPNGPIIIDNGNAGIVLSS